MTIKTYMILYPVFTINIEGIEVQCDSRTVSYAFPYFVKGVTAQNEEVLINIYDDIDPDTQKHTSLINENA
jgi:hypothetical protein